MQNATPTPTPAEVFTTEQLEALEGAIQGAEQAPDDDGTAYVPAARTGDEKPPIRVAGPGSRRAKIDAAILHTLHSTGRLNRVRSIVESANKRLSRAESEGVMRPDLGRYYAPGGAIRFAESTARTIRDTLGAVIRDLRLSGSLAIRLVKRPVYVAKGDPVTFYAPVFVKVTHPDANPEQTAASATADLAARGIL